MSHRDHVILGWVAGALLIGVMAHTQELRQPPDPRTYVRPVLKPRAPPPHRPASLRPPAAAAAVPSAVSERATATPVAASALGSTSAFATAGHETVAAGTPLAAPVSITYGGASPALLVTDTGSNKGIESLITNSKNQTSAVYGETNGSGAGVTGYNTGLTGPAGKFEMTNATSDQPAIAATTFGLGSAIGATVSNNNSRYVAAISGVNNSSVEGVNFGTGVEGDGSDVGVYGASQYGVGMSAHSYMGTALYAETDDGADAIFATNTYATAISAQTEYGVGVSVDGGDQAGTGIMVTTSSGTGIHVFSSDAGALYAESGGGTYGIWGQSSNGTGVMGEDSGSGYGVYGSSVSGYAGYFDGKVAATSFVTLSDRNAKTHLQAVDRSDILERVGNLPISSWDFKGDSDTRHVGPMAQDFHAAFGLGGNDDTHINLADIAGISLAAIQELNAKLQVKDAQIADLTAQLAEVKSIAEQLAVRMNSMEHR